MPVASIGPAVVQKSLPPSQPMAMTAGAATGGPEAWQLAQWNSETGDKGGGGGGAGGGGPVSNNEGWYMFTALLLGAFLGGVAFVAGGFKAAAVGMAGGGFSMGVGSAWAAGW